jgi:hypothetical protein
MRSKPPAARHVDAVVVARAQVQRGKVAAVEVRGQRTVAADQRGGAVAVALGLEDLIAVQVTELADGTVHRAQQAASLSGRAPGLSARVKKSLKLA